MCIKRYKIGSTTHKMKLRCSMFDLSLCTMPIFFNPRLYKRKKKSVATPIRITHPHCQVGTKQLTPKNWITSLSLSLSHVMCITFYSRLVKQENGRTMRLCPMKDYNCGCPLCSSQSMAIYYTYNQTFLGFYVASSQMRVKDWGYSVVTQFF